MFLFLVKHCKYCQFNEEEVLINKRILIAFTVVRVCKEEKVFQTVWNVRHG